MVLPALHTVRIRDLLTAIAAEPTDDGRLATLALADPGWLTEMDIMALAVRLSRHMSGRDVGPGRMDERVPAPVPRAR